MYIQPQTNIKLLRNVPLDPTFDHTIWFGNATSQYNYFAGKQAFNLTDYTYQRVNKGIARVGIKADSLYNCNYMMFQNTAYGNKWFYAFITSVEFVNNECSEITFEIDVMQTWFFDYTLNMCFVEREHTETDNLGEHIEPENVSTGEYVFNDYAPVYNMADIAIVVAVVEVDGENASIDGKKYDGIYGGATLWVYDVNKFAQINDKLKKYIQKPDAVVSIYTIPKVFLPNGTIPSSNRIPELDSSLKITSISTALTGNENIDGYKPKNKKLYTYPYNFYHVDNAGANSLALRYEFFDKFAPSIEINANVTQPVTVCLRPTNYKGSGDKTNNTESISLTGYPLCSWNVDSYNAWVAQNSVSIGSRLAGIGAGVIGAGLTANPLAIGGALVSGVGQVASLLTQDYKASIQADMIKGNPQGNLNVSSRKQQFYVGRMSITAEYARIIDDYFTRFGYGVKRLKVPNRSSRPHWNYVKTAGCTISASVPADDERQICGIYDKGITFWKNGSEIGNYALDNRPR